MTETPTTDPVTEETTLLNRVLALGGVGRRYLPHTALLMSALAVLFFIRLDPIGRVQALDLQTAPQVEATNSPEDEQDTLIFATPVASGPEANANADAIIVRDVDPITNIPARARTAPIAYQVQPGDSLYGIAEKHGLNAETILWSNVGVLADDPHNLNPGQELLIPPTDGVLHLVQEADGINGVAKGLNVDIATLIDYEGNDIDKEEPELIPGTYVMAVGGWRDLKIPGPVLQETTQTTSTGQKIFRAFWSSAGSGACAGEGSYRGPIGNTSFVWPANNRSISGYNYSGVHQGLDIAAGIGDPIYTSDNGVVVFSGWSHWGYGNMVVVDHGNGFQSVYAHLSQINVGCGQGVSQGGLIGLAGSTGNSSGPHLHYEILFNGARQNPWSYLQ